MNFLHKIFAMIRAILMKFAITNVSFAIIYDKKTIFLLHFRIDIYIPTSINFSGIYALNISKENNKDKYSSFAIELTSSKNEKKRIQDF